MKDIAPVGPRKTVMFFSRGPRLFWDRGGREERVLCFTADRVLAGGARLILYSGNGQALHGHIFAAAQSFAAYAYPDVAYRCDPSGGGEDRFDP